MNEALWYLGRGTGVMSLVLFTLAVVLGVVSRAGRPLPGLPRFAVAAVHRNVSLIALGLLLVHMVSLLLDPYAKLKILDLVVPFDTVYRPLWVGLGTLAADLVFVLIATSLLRHRLGAASWRTIHWLSYAMWPAAWLHGWNAGTDAELGWFRWITLLCLGLVTGVVAWRFGPAAARLARVLGPRVGQRLGPRLQQLRSGRSQ